MFSTLAPGVAVAGNIIQDWNQDRRDSQAREWQEKMVNQANAYNSPVAQRNRMIAAGFNPNLLAGQPMEGFASAPSPAQGSRPASFDDVASTLINLYQSLTAAEVNQAQAEALQSSKQKTDVESALLIRNEGRSMDEHLYNKGLRPIQEQRAESAEKRAEKADKRAEDENSRQQGNYDFEATLREWRRRSVIAQVTREEVDAKYAETRAKDEHLAAQAGLKLSAAELYSKYDDVAESLIYADVLHYDSNTNKWVVDDANGLAEKLFYRELGLSPNAGKSTKAVWTRFKNWLKEAFRNPPDKDGNRKPAIGDWFTDDD